MYVIQKWKHNDMYYMLLGAQRENKTGTLLLYKSQDLYNWHFQGEITTNLKEFGFMWECPDYFQLSGKDVLLFSPQGIEKDGENFHNVYNVVYAIGHFDIKIYISMLIPITKLIKGSIFMPLKL